MAATLKYNPAHDAFQVSKGGFEWAEPISEDPTMVLPDSECPMLVVLEHADLEGLKKNTVYKLVEIPTEILPEEEIELD